MKKSLFFFLFLPLGLVAQVQTVAKHEPSLLYREIHDALAIGKTRQAMLTFDKVVEFYTLEHRTSELPESYFGMALALAFNGNYKQSIRYHRKAIRAHKKYREDSPQEIYANLGLTYRMAGKDRMAEKLLKKSE